MSDQPDFSRPPSPPESDSADLEEPHEPSWERWRELGVVRAWGRTVFEIFARPRSTFTRLRRDGSRNPALLFYLLTNALSQFLSNFIGAPILFYYGAVFGADPRSNPFGAGGFIRPGQALGTALVSVLFGIVWWLVVLYVETAAVVIAIRMTGHEKIAFDRAFRILAYVAGACGMIFILASTAGYLFFVPLVLVYGTIALSADQELTGGRAFFALLCSYFALLFCCCCGAGSLSGIFSRGF